MAEPASLVLEFAGQKSSPEPFSPKLGLVEDPLKAPTTSDPLDLEAANNTQESTRPLFVDIVVGGMTCTMCSQAINRALLGMDGVANVTVSLSTDVAHVEMDASKKSQYAEFLEEIQEMITDIGYMVVDVIAMPGMSLTPSQTEPDINGNDAPNSLAAGSEAGNNEQENNNSSREGGNSTQQDRWNRIAQRQAEKLQQRKTAFLWSLIGTIPVLLLTMIIPNILPHNGAIMHWWENQHIHLFHKDIPVE